MSQQHEIKAGRRASRRQSRLLQETKESSDLVQENSEYTGGRESIFNQGESTYRSDGRHSTHTSRQGFDDSRSTVQVGDLKNDLSEGNFEIDNATVFNQRSKETHEDTSINSSIQIAETVSKPFSGMSRRKMSQVEQHM